MESERVWKRDTQANERRAADIEQVVRARSDSPRTANPIDGYQIITNRLGGKTVGDILESPEPPTTLSPEQVDFKRALVASAGGNISDFPELQLAQVESDEQQGETELADRQAGVGGPVVAEAAGTEVLES